MLHAHLPYVHHPEHESFFEENWLFEAITECYLPLIKVFERLAADHIPFRITLSLSPTLLTMLQDGLLQQRYLKHMERLLALTEKEIQRTRREPAFNGLARWYQQMFSETVLLFKNRYKKNLVNAFKKLQKAGFLEIITTSATHAFLPLLKPCPSSVRAQVFTGLEYCRSVFGAAPPGIWLPECGYYPGLETVLQEAGYRYFFLDTHGIINADSQPRYGSYAPVACPNSMASFCRDKESSRQVWSSQEGYPGDFAYREYYRDIGFEQDTAHLAPLSSDGTARMPTGIKYYRITGRHDQKEPYDPQAAQEKAALHAAHFLACRQEEISCQANRMDRPPLVVAPFDAELFGHWWFEGPQWLDALIRKIAGEQDTLELITPSDYLQAHPVLQMAAPSASSWGYLGYNEVWLNSTNDWIYPYLHSASLHMEKLAAEQRPRRGSRPDRALKQAARSLLLAQASDWPFIMKTGTTIAYARSRIRDHLARFHYLAKSIDVKKIDELRLSALETMDDIFPDIDYRHFCPPHHIKDDRGAAW
ncbi:MAG: 1,4-alpha-glucan branching protein domain-containing protein [Pseudomonadota bacterium]